MDAPTPPEPPKGFEPEEPLFVPDFDALPPAPTPEARIHSLAGWAAIFDSDDLEVAPRQFTTLPEAEEGVYRNEQRLSFIVSHACRVVRWGLFMSGLGPESLLPRGNLFLEFDVREGDTVLFEKGHLEVRID